MQEVRELELYFASIRQNKRLNIEIKVKTIGDVEDAHINLIFHVQYLKKISQMWWRCVKYMFVFLGNFPD